MSGVDGPVEFIDTGAGALNTGNEDQSEIGGTSAVTVVGLVAAVALAIVAGLMLSGGDETEEAATSLPTTMPNDPPTTVSVPGAEAGLPERSFVYNRPSILPDELPSISSSPLSELDDDLIVRLAVSSHLTSHISVLDVSSTAVTELAPPDAEVRVFPAFDPSLQFDASGEWVAGLGNSWAPERSPVLWVGPARGPLRPLAMAVNTFSWDLIEPGRILWTAEDGAVLELDKTTGPIGVVDGVQGRLIQAWGDDIATADESGLARRAGSTVGPEGSVGLGFAPGGFVYVDAEAQLGYVRDDGAAAEGTPIDVALDWGSSEGIRLAQAHVEVDPTGSFLAIRAQDSLSRTWLAVTDIEGRELLAIQASEDLGPFGWAADGRYFGFTDQTTEFVNHVYVFDTTDNALYSTGMAGSVEGVQRVADVAVLVG